VNINRVSRYYHELFPEERWRLILAAMGRGDELEVERLTQAAPRVVWMSKDYVPVGLAFDELQLSVLLEVVDLAADYRAALQQALRLDGEKGQDAAGLALAVGYLLRARVMGWRLFCRKLTAPPFLCWRGLPGFTRVKKALASARDFSFSKDGFRDWFRKMEPESKTVPMTASAAARIIMKRYRDNVQRLGGVLANGMRPRGECDEPM
jgi:hypothetical protein